MQAQSNQKSDKDGVRNTIVVALLVSLCCSIMVSGTAILLRAKQVENRLYYGGQQTVIQLIEAIYPDAALSDLLRGLEIKFVDLATGDYVEGFDPATFDQRELAQDPAQSTPIPDTLDIAGIESRENTAMVYLLERAGRIETVILPIYGRGMWSTIYAYAALSSDANTISGLIIQEHGETPGIGDKIENPEWLASWQGKQVYENGMVVIGSSPSDQMDQEFQIDVIVGATRTVRALVNTVRYWLGEHGYQVYLEKLKQEMASEA